MSKDSQLITLNLEAAQFVNPKDAYRWTQSEAPNMFQNSWGPLLQDVVTLADTQEFFALLKGRVTPTYAPHAHKLEKTSLKGIAKKKNIGSFLGGMDINASIHHDNGNTTIRLYKKPIHPGKREMGLRLNESRRFITLEYRNHGSDLTAVSLVQEDRAGNGDLAVREVKCLEKKPGLWNITDKKEIYYRSGPSHLFKAHNGHYTRLTGAQAKLNGDVVSLPEWWVMGSVGSQDRPGDATTRIHAYHKPLYFHPASPTEFMTIPIDTDGVSADACEADCVLYPNGKVRTSEPDFMAGVLGTLPVDVNLLPM